MKRIILSANKAGGGRGEGSEGRGVTLIPEGSNSQTENWGEEVFQAEESFM